MRPQAGLPSLSLSRYYRSRVMGLSGSLGYDHFLSTDTYLRIAWRNPDGTGVAVRYEDPADLTTRFKFLEQVAADVTDDGILHTEFGVFRDLRLYDAAQALTASALLAVTAVITDIDGGTRTFEVINLDDGPTRCCRLLQITNRVGVNLQTISYQFAPVAPLSDMDGDRNRLWQVATVTAADLTQAVYAYDTIKRAGRFPVIAISLPNGSITTFQYSGDVLVSQELPGRGTATFARSYDAILQKIKTVIDDPAAKPGHQKKTVWWSGTSFILPDATTISQTEGQIFRIDNAAGETSYMAWNEAHSKVEFATNKYVWSSEIGLELFEVTAGAEQVSTYSRAPDFILGQDPAGAFFSERTVYTNDVKHRLVTGENDSIGRIKTYAYDVTTRRLTAVKDAAGFLTVATYNDRAEPLTVTDELGRITEFTYDQLGNQLSKMRGLGSETSIWQWAYDSRGLVTAETDANGNRTDLLFDARGRLIRVSEPADAGGGVRYARDFTYDAAGRLIVAADQANRQTAYTYDAANRLIRRTYSDGSTEGMIYGGGATAGLLIAMIDRNGVPTTYAYDVAGRRNETRIADGRPEVSSEVVTYAAGSPTRIATRLLDGDALTMTYDGEGRGIAESAFPRAGQSLVNLHVYDQAERNFAHRDAYGRWTYQVFDQLDRTVRTVHELVPGAVGDADQVRALAVALSPATAFAGIDIGSPALAGSTVVAGGTITIRGAGTDTDLWAANDQLQYYSSAVASDAALRVRLDSQTQPERWSKAGVMLRSSMAVDAPFVGLLVSMDGISVQYRNQPNDFIMWPGVMAAPGKHAPVWLQAQLVGHIVNLSISDDGLSWTAVAAIPFQRQAGARMGLSVTSRNAAQYSTAVFSNLSLVVGAPDPARTTVLTNDYLASLIRAPGVNPGYVIEDIEFDGSGMMTAQSDGRGIRSTIGYDTQVRVSATTEAVGTADAATTTYVYDAQGNRIRINNPRGFATINGYGGRNLFSEMTVAYGTINAATTAYTYSPTHKALTTTDALGRVTVNTYAICCDRLETITDPAGFVTTLAYDFVGNRTSVTDGNQLTMLTAYDGRNRPVTVTNAAGETTTMAYVEDASVLPEAAGLGLGAGADGMAMSTTNPHQERSLAIRDGLGRIVRQVDALGHQTTFGLDALVSDGGVTLVAMTSTDPLAHTTTAYFDGAGRARVSLDALQLRSSMGYDAVGNRITWRDANAIGMDCVFDARNREVTCTDTAAAVTRKAYDANNNLLASTDALSKVESSQFDERDRRIATTDRVAATTAFVYDAVSNLLSITDAEGGTTLYRYDARNLLDREVFPQGRGVRSARYYAYDPGRRLVSRALAGIPLLGVPPANAPLANELTTYRYDAANRLIERGYPDHLNDDFTYDTVSRLTGANSARYANQVARLYDAAGRLTKETLSFTNAAEAADLPVSYVYDNANRVTRLTYPDGSQVQRAYTDRNELQQIWDGDAPQFTRGYDVGGRLGVTQYGNGLKEFRTYIANDNLIASIAIADVTNFAYTYDANKRKTGERDWQIGGNSQHFSYDDENRVVRWKRGNDPADPAGETDAWELSPVGDWATFSRTPGAGPTTVEHRTHDPVHELLAINAAALAYDVKGNLTHDDGGQDFSWDFEDHLRTAERLAQGQGDRSDYDYDALGRRVKKTVITTVPLQSVPTYFVSAGVQEVLAITGDITAFNDPSADPDEIGAAPFSSVTGVGARGSLLSEPSATRFNFQPTSSDTPDGWLADGGDLPTTPSSHGWTSMRSPVDRAHLGRPLYDTFIPLDSATWKLAVANGTHAVVLMCGDADSRAQTNNLLVNGMPVVDSTPYDGLMTLGYETGSFDGYALTVDVTDGFIAIQSGIGAQLPKICFIEVGQVGSVTDAAITARVQAAAVQVTHDTAKPKAKTPPMVKRNVWGTYVDELVSYTFMKPRHAASRYFAHANHLYSVAAVTDTAGTVVERYTYDTYGRQAIVNSSGGGRIRSLVGWDRGFTGYIADNESGLLHARARMYDARLGRFLSRDPYTKIFGWHVSGFGSDQTRVESVVNFRNLPGLDYFDSYSLYSASMGLRQWIDPSGMQGGPPGGNNGAGNMGNPPACAAEGDPATNWGDGRTSTGNCWRYACDQPAKPKEPHSPYPGPFPGGGKDPGGVLTCAQVMAGARAGGGKDPKADGTCDCKWWKIAVVLDTKGKDTDGDGKPDYNDYHFYRQQKDGTWSHKPGNSASITGVKDPDADAKKRGYDTTCGYLCVTK